MTVDVDPELITIDRFLSAIYWSDDDITLTEALPVALDEWCATASAEHHDNRSFSTGDHHDELEASLHELLAAVQHLRGGPRPNLTVIRAVSEALADWDQ